jgi:ubiquinone biosynthesis protein COQ9
MTGIDESSSAPAEGAHAVRERLIDAALALAQLEDWEAVRLRDVAEAADVPLSVLAQHFREKEDLVEAFFDRADRALLSMADDPLLPTLPSRARLHRLIMAWLDALAPHRDTVRQMIANKLEPGHLHVQIPALLRISRTVQWVREAAGRDAMFLRRAIEEAALTSIYVTTFVYWMRDTSENAEDTRRLLARNLERAEALERLMRWESAPPARMSEPAPAEMRGSGAD